MHMALEFGQFAVQWRSDFGRLPQEKQPWEGHVASLQFFLLGTPHLEHHGHSVNLSRRKAVAVLWKVNYCLSSRS
jgi:hypothetical protein